ncbi:metallophosphoesterase [Mucilaginibacter sp. HD30]
MAKRLPFIILLWLLSNLYFYQAIKTISVTDLYAAFYWLINVLLIGGIVSAFFVRRGSGLQQTLITWLMGLMLLVLVPSLMATPFLLIEDLTRIVRGFPPRSLWVSQVAVIIAGIAFLVVLFGITRGRHFYRLKKSTLIFPDLPAAFDGFTITQITDVHSGSFMDAEGVKKGLELVNTQRSDVILFTGDLVNNKAAEMDPWITPFAGLKASMGKYSVLGNHDYGDYVKWESDEAKEANLKRLKEVHGEMGFRLLLDESISLQKDGAAINLIGVENWGKGGFHKYGDLKKATLNVPDKGFKILLSHDPSHWEAVTLNHEQHIHLTLSGHTHGMQFGIDFLGFKWSPVQYVYKQWLGLYHSAGRYLYVNRGFGFIGLKGRIGMWPEVAVITLKRG